MRRPAPGEPIESQFDRVGAGAFAVRGPMTFGTARRLCADGLRQLEADGSAQIEIDCGAVTAADSGGLAVIMEWFRWARSTGRRLRCRGLPRELGGLARISELDELLATGV